MEIWNKNKKLDDFVQNLARLSDPIDKMPYCIFGDISKSKIEIKKGFMIDRITEQPFCQTDVIRSVCKHETTLGGDGYFYCADCGAGRL